MSLKTFLKVVEIQTKLASLFPFLIGVLFSVTYFQQFNVWYTIVFFIAMLVFDMTTTAINNYMDFKKAKSETYKYQENIIGTSGVNPQVVRRLIFVMLLFSAAVGLYLTWLTSWLLLFMGGICCFIGVFYTFGPIPLSRMPLGEIFSGFTMGLGIFVITVYLNTQQQPPFDLFIDWSSGGFAFVGSLWAIAAIFCAAFPLVFTIANIMLANNLRDLDTDIENHRYTLVFYIGRPAGIQLFTGLMYACYVVIVVGLFAGLYQWPILVTLLTFPKIRQNLQEFKQALPHPRSFGYSIKNLIVFNSSYALGLVLTLLVRAFQ